jgi:hypothetical protein
MSHPVNDEILERLYEEALDELKEKYPASNIEENIALVNVATRLARKRFEELSQ